MSDLRVLGELILDSIETIESRFSHEDIDFPALANPFNGECKAESILLEPEISTARSYIVAAASQLIAMVRSPVQTMVENGLVFHLPSCIRAAVESNVVEIIREAGSQGIHANDIAKKNNTDPTKAARILRLLANHHIFTEISPDVFCLNRLSSVLDSGKTVVELQKNRHRHFSTSGISALISMQTDEGFKGSAHLTEAFTHRDTAHSTRAADSPWNIAAQTNAFLFDWYDRPENSHLKTRFSFAMACSTKLEPPQAILAGFEWGKLPKASLIVDLGGGVGSTTLIIANAVPQAKFVVQDRSSVIEDAKTYWAQTAPQLLRSGRVTLEVHDFFEPQPRRETAVFLLRWVMHDWADSSAVRILKHLRDAATPQTRLITVDIILPYTCHDTTSTRQIAGAGFPPAPAPLLPNMGAASNMNILADFCKYKMFVLGNCQERTLDHFVQLAFRGGWRVCQVHHIPGSALSQCVSVPI
ncbi:O-methyltransferase [Mycena olivaceomarginata]|nr:O-methyltransferase [Mycena olivaceomarginata]